MYNITLDKISFHRIILYLEGNAEGEATPDKARFYLKNRESGEELDVVEIKTSGTWFRLRINVLERCREYPITTGMWDLLADMPDEKGIKVIVKESIREDIDTAKKNDIMLSDDSIFAVHDEEYDDDDSYEDDESMTVEMDTDLKLLIFKKANNFWSGKSEYTEEDGAYYLDVEYVLPEAPKRGVAAAFKRRMKKIKRGLSRAFSKIKRKGYESLFSFFNKTVKKRGDKVFFTSDREGKLAGNEKCVYDRMIERGLGDKYRFCFDFKDSIKTSRSLINKFKFTYYLATSDTIFVDDYQPELYKNKYDPSVRIVQLWHACGAFKTIGFERLGKKGSPSFNTRVHKCYTHVTVSSDHSADHNAEAFCINRSKFYATGIPRTDKFFDEEYKKSVREKVINAFPAIRDARRVILYAPTFRGINAKSAKFPFKDVGFGKIGRYIKNEGDLMLVKMHPFVRTQLPIPDEYKESIIDVTAYPDINELLMAVDLLITDYSSVIYEAGLLKLPMLFYAFDLDKYDGDRGFYEPFEEMVPGKIVTSTAELLAALKSEDYEKEKLEGFLAKNFKYLDGHSTDRVIDLLFGNEDGKSLA